VCYDLSCRGADGKGRIDPLAEHFSAVNVRSSYLLSYIFPVCAYGGVIFSLSSLSTLPKEMPSCWGFDKIIHFIEYYVFGYLIFRYFAGWEGGTFPQRHSILLTAGSGVF